MKQPRWDEPIEYRGQLRQARPEEMIEFEADQEAEAEGD